MDLDVHLEAIGAGDTQAFARWVAGAEPPVRASLARFAAQVDVEIVVQEALLRAWQAAPRVQRDGRGNCLLRFTLRAAQNLAIDEVRHRRREVVRPADDHELPCFPSNPTRCCGERSKSAKNSYLRTRRGRCSRGWKLVAPTLTSRSPRGWG